MQPPRGRLSLLCYAVVCAMLAAGVYVVAFDTARGRTWDATTLARATAGQHLPAVQRASTRLIDTIDVGSLVLFGGAIVAVAVVLGRPRAGLAAALLIAGANVTTQVLKPALGDAAPFGKRGELASSFPSGHSTVAMSLALAAVLAAPAGWKVVVGLAGAAYATGVGISLLVQGWHFPSDVAAAFLLTGAWAAVVALVVPARERVAPPRSVRVVWIGGGVALVGFGVAIAIAVATHPGLTFRVELHTKLVVVFASLAGLAVAVAGGLALLLVAQAIALRNASTTRS